MLYQKKIDYTIIHIYIFIHIYSSIFNTRAYNHMPPFCKICYNLGLSNFNNHNVRDSARNITCPYLLNTKCKKCGYFGHTSKYCKMKINFNINHSLLSTNTLNNNHNNNNKSLSQFKNYFELLNNQSIINHNDHDYHVHDGDGDDDDDDDDDDEERLPDLSKIQWGKIVNNKSWADRVEKYYKNKSLIY